LAAPSKQEDTQKGHSFENAKSLVVLSSFQFNVFLRQYPFLSSGSIRWPAIDVLKAKGLFILYYKRTFTTSY
jgi:hypothetical protein